MKTSIIVSFLLLFCINLSIAQKESFFVGELDTKNESATMTISQEEAATFLEGQLSEKASVSEIEILHFKDKSGDEYFISGKVTGSKKNVNRISIKLIEDGGGLKVNPGFGTKISCIGAPCNECTLERTSGLNYACVCKEENCSYCRCNQHTETTIGF